MQLQVGQLELSLSGQTMSPEAFRGSAPVEVTAP